MKKIRILYFGTWGYGMAGLEGLLRSEKVEIVKVFTKWLPDKKDQYMDQVKILAEKNGLDCFNTHRDLCNKFEFRKAVLNHTGVDYILSCCYDRIFTSEILNHPSKMAINVHPSLLPKYRGIKPLENAIIQNEKEVGITMHKLEKELDSGNILSQKGEIKLASNLTYDELYKQQCNLITEMVFDFFQSPNTYIEQAYVQDESKISLAPRPPFKIDGHMTVEEIIALSKA